MQMVHVYFLIAGYQPYWSLGSKNYHLPWLQRYVWYGESLTQMAMDHMQHQVYIGSKNAMMYALEFAVFRQGVAVLNILCSINVCLYPILTIHVPTWTVVFVLVPLYNSIHYCALLGYTQVQQYTWIWQHRTKQQPDLDALFKVSSNPCDIHIWLQLDKPEGYLAHRHNIIGDFQFDD